MKTYLSLALAAALAAPIAAPVDGFAKNGGGKRTILSCAAEGDTDISISAKYVVREKKNRRSFKAEFEAAPGLGYKVGQRVTVLVADIEVGKAKLKLTDDGDLEAELELKSKREPGHRTFPPNFPEVKAGTTVTITVPNQPTLSCDLG